MKALLNNGAKITVKVTRTVAQKFNHTSRVLVELEKLHGGPKPKQSRRVFKEYTYTPKQMVVR